MWKEERVEHRGGRGEETVLMPVERNRFCIVEEGVGEGGQNQELSKLKV